MAKNTVVKEKKPMYKKWWFWLIAVIIVGAVASGGETGTDSATGSITDEVGTETVEGAEANEDTESVVEEEEEAEPVEEVKPVEVYSDDWVTISFKEATAEGVKFLVENKTDKSLTIQADSVAINGFSTNEFIMSDDIAPQSKGYATVQTSELADAGDAETVSGQLRIIDMGSSDWETRDATFTNVSVKQ